MASKFAMTSTHTTSEGFVNLTHTPSGSPGVARFTLTEAALTERILFAEHALAVMCCDVCNVRFAAYTLCDVERDRLVKWCFNCGVNAPYRELTRDQYKTSKGQQTCPPVTTHLGITNVQPGMLPDAGGQLNQSPSGAAGVPSVPFTTMGIETTASFGR